MKIVDLDKVKGVKNLILTIGCFDGLHLGHQKVIKTVIAEAKNEKGTSAILTFNRHPRSVTKNIQISFLMAPKEKFKLLDELGINLCVLANFNQSFANLSAQTFCEEILKKRLEVKEVIVSSAFRFGKERIGDVNLLRKLGKKLNFSVKAIEPLKIKDRVVSSSMIRNLVKEAKFKEVKTFLGRDFSVLGKVIPGEKRGRVLGYPTANLKIDYTLNFPLGVHLVMVKIDEKLYNGLINFGFRPTFNRFNKFPTAEVHLFNFKRDLYHQEITIIFKKKIRDEIDFSGDKIALLKQIKKDERKAKKMLATTDGRR